MNQLPYVEMSQQYGGKGGNPFNPSTQSTSVLISECKRSESDMEE